MVLPSKYWGEDHVKKCREEYWHSTWHTVNTPEMNQWWRVSLMEGLALPQICCVTLGKSFVLSGPQSSRPSGRNDYFVPAQGGGKAQVGGWMWRFYMSFPVRTAGFPSAWAVQRPSRCCQGISRWVFLNLWGGVIRGATWGRSRDSISRGTWVQDMFKDWPLDMTGH